MKAAVVGETALEIREVPQPKPKPTEVLVKVRAIGMNRAELPGSYGSGHTRVTGTVPGIEWSGEVVECGAEVKGVKPGDRVMCVGQAGYAEYAVADWGRTTPIPANNVSWEQAATYPVALGTMHDAIVTNAKLQRGEAIMIQGASSGAQSSSSAPRPMTRVARGSRSSAPTSSSIHAKRTGPRTC
jgi:NADPH2:quinone reductase